METIVVGVDGSPASLGALSWADDIAERARAALVAVRADVAPATPAVPPVLHAERRDTARRELEGWCKERDLAVVPTTVVVDDDPRRALMAVAAEHHGDLLVIGASGTGGLAGLLLGGVAHHLALHPTLPLAVVPAQRPDEIRRIVVGVDGSDGSLAAVRFCADLAGELGVPVTAVLAQEPFAEWVPAFDPGSWRRKAERQLREWVTPIASAEVPVDILVDRDIHPVAAITRAIRQHPGAVAIVGTRGRGGFPGLRLGRVPVQLLHHADVPLVIVPADTRS
jgi:nucleotide-binding universal stress UspA family protein